MQLAACLGAHVIAPPVHAIAPTYLRALGASEAVNDAQTDLVAAVRATHPEGIDAVLDCVGGEMAASYSITSFPF